MPLTDARLWYVQNSLLNRRGYVSQGSFSLGTTEPNVSNTGFGVLGYTAATLVDQAAGDLIITTNGTTVEGKRIHGFVRVDANNVTIRGCEIVSYPSHPYLDTSHYGLLSSSGTGNLFEYNTLSQYNPVSNTDNSLPWPVGILLNSGTATVSRNNIHDVNDHIYIKGGTHQIQGNFLHDPGFRTDDTDQAGSTPANWSHNDGVQVMGGTNHVIDGNSFVMKFSTLTGMSSTANPDPTAEQVWLNCHGILMSNTSNAVTGVLIKRNWFKYGSVGPHFTTGANGPGSATLDANRFTPDQSREFSQYVQIRIDPTTSWTVTDAGTNVYSNDSDTPLAWQGVLLKAPITGGTTRIWAYNSSAHTP